MNSLYKIFIILFFYLIGHLSLCAQILYKVHSHNDYKQELPFFHAYDNGASSIEVDVFLKNDTLYVTHHENEIIPGNTIESLYLDKLKNQVLSRKLRELQLLIDIKSGAHATLKQLTEVIGTYPLLKNSKHIYFVISGNRPDPKDYTDYPDFILFDHQNLKDLDKIPLEKVALVSLSFRKFSNWNGKGRMAEAEWQKIKKIVEKVHGHGKAFRFWATPDTEMAWAQLAKLGLDFINTDHPGLAKQYLDHLGEH